MAELDPHKQRQFALEVVERLRAGGFTAYWAGGCVRDQLLGRRPKDYDVATNATPAEIRQVFSHRRTLAIGAAFGVITVLGPKDSGPIEVTTFRQDATYSDGRHPDAVSFSTPEGDAQRRDFTVNGLFFDPLAGQVIDFVGGQADLERQVLRAIGNPRERFAEDKLRMLRAVRFASIYGFTIESDTLGAIQQMAAEVTLVSTERIAAEMRLMLVNPQRAAVIELLEGSGLLGIILPEVGQALESPITKSYLLRVLAALEHPTWPLALAALLHVSVDGAGAKTICERWRLSNKEVDRVQWLVEHQESLAGARTLQWSRLRPLLIADGIDELIELHEAIARATQAETIDFEYCRLMLAQPQEILDPPPLLGGNDLMRHGVPRGKIYQWLLAEVRAAQLDNRIHTRQQALELVDQLRESPEAHQ